MYIKDINFFERYDEIERREKNVSKEQAIAVIIIGIMVFGTIIVTTVLNIFKINLENELILINTELNSPQVMKQIEETTKKQQFLEGMTHYYNAIELAGSKLQTFIQPDEKLIKSFQHTLPQGVHIKSFDYNNGSIILECSGTTQVSLATYVEKLKELENVHQVGYTGFTKNEDTTYACTIGITLTPGGTIYE